MTARPLLALVVVALSLWGCGSGSLGIETFAASTTQVSLGQPVHLTWTVNNARGLQLLPAGSVEGLTGVTLYPGQTTTYMLQATGADGGMLESKPITITVGAGLDCRVQKYNTLAYAGAVVTARVNDATGQRASVATPISLTLPKSDVSRSFTCAAGARGCVAVFADLPQPAANVSYQATATVDGQTVTTTCPQLIPSVSQQLALPLVTASRTDASTLQASWGAVPGATSYRVSVLDLDTGTAVGSPLVTTATSTPLAAAVAHNLAVQVEAADFDWSNPELPDLPDAEALSRGNGFVAVDPGFTLYTPASFNGTTLSVSLPSLASGEQVAIIPMNLTSVDNVTANIAITNVQTPPSSSVGTAAGVASLRSDPIFHAQLRLKEQRLAAELALHPKATPGHAIERATAPPDTTTFCTLSAASSSASRRTAVLKATTAHAAFYVDQTDLADYTPYESPAVPDASSIWSQLSDLWENTIYPTDTGTFGAESDVDGNGRLLIFFSRQLGPAVNGAIELGYYDSEDVVGARDTSANCSGSASNDADLFYMNGIGNILPASPTQAEVDRVIQELYPDTLAHEFQHLINFNQHHLIHDPGNVFPFEATWINEGLSVTAEDLTGFGWNVASGQQDGALYLNRVDGDSILRYSTASLIDWQADPIGNYQGAHSFIRLLADRQPAALGQLVQTSDTGISNLERVLAAPFEWTFSSWTGALLFSNESFVPAPRFNYTGAGWTPLHQKLASHDASGNLTRQGYLRFVPLGTTPATATLRTYGYNVFVTGAAAAPGQSATLTVSSSTPPHVAVIRFVGTLPEGNVVQ